MNLSTIKQINVIGCGGIGSWLIKPLGRQLNYEPRFTGHFFLIDGDVYKENNLERQDCPEVLLGKNKAEAQHVIIDKNYPKLLERTISAQEYIGEDNVGEFVIENSLTFTCVDNDDARWFVDEHMKSLQNAVHICGGNDKTFGQVVLTVRKNGESVTPTYFDHYPEALKRRGNDRRKMSCDELSRLPGGGQTICVNNMASSIMFSFFNSVIEYGANINYYPCTHVEYDILHVNATRRGERELQLV